MAPGTLSSGGTLRIILSVPVGTLSTENSEVTTAASSWCWRRGGVGDRAGVGDRDRDCGLVDRAGLSEGGATSDCGMLDCFVLKYLIQINFTWHVLQRGSCKRLVTEWNWSKGQYLMLKYLIIVIVSRLRSSTLSQTTWYIWFLMFFYGLINWECNTASQFRILLLSLWFISAF